jgi:hypothetical protein
MPGRSAAMLVPRLPGTAPNHVEYQAWIFGISDSGTLKCT